MLYNVFLPAFIGFWIYGACQPQTSFIETPVDTLAIPGRAAQLNCSVNNGTVVWSMETGNHYEPISFGNETRDYRYIITGDHKRGEFHLLMVNVAESMESMYRCTVKETNLTAYASLYVLESGPNCNVIPGTSVIENTNTAIFNCSIDLPEDAPGGLVWLRNGAVVVQSTTKTLTHSTTLQRTDNGDVFSCRFSDSLITLSCWQNFSMDVQYPPDVDVPDDNNAVKEDDTYTKNCVVDSNPTARVQWLYNGGVVRETAQLVLNQVRRSHSGEYTCRAQTTFWDGSSDIDTDSFQLDVQYFQDVVIETSSNVVIEGKYYSKRCHVDANPEASIEWKRSGTVVTSDGLLEFQPVSSSHRARYECMATITFYDGSQEIDNDYFDLDVQYPPTVHTSDDKVSRQEGQSVTLTCDAVGNPAPDVSWVLVDGSTRSGRHLELIGLEREAMGVYTCVGRNTYHDGSTGIGNDTTSLDIHYEPSVMQSESTFEVQADVGSNATLVCVVDANPTPSFDWTKDNKDINEGVEVTTEGMKSTSTLTITFVSENDYGVYISRSSNNVPPEVTCKIKLVEKVGSSTGDIIGAVVGTLFILCLIAVVAYFAYRRRNQPLNRGEEYRESEHSSRQQFTDVGQSQENPYATPQEHSLELIHTEKIEDNAHGAPEGHYQDLIRTEKDQSTYASLEKYKSLKRGTVEPDYMKYGQTTNSFNRQYLDMSESIGKGSFGQVYRATASDIAGKTGKTEVAVKSVKDNASSDDMKRLLVELSILKLVGTHLKIVSLLGCCDDTEPVYIIMEYMAKGSLQKYLRNYRRDKTSHYANLSEGSVVLTYKDLLSFAEQVASGMEYLASKNFVHGELASRCVLLTENKTCKLSNIGLRGNSDIDAKRVKETRLLVRWMAPETLNSSEYTIMSDKWSFGILLWEIVTLGNTPYPTAKTVADVKAFITRGFRMKRPAYCHEKLYSVMIKCWSKNKTERPKFSRLIIELQSMAKNSEPCIDVKRACADSSQYKTTTAKKEKC